MTNFETMAKRIMDCKTREDLQKANVSLDRIFKAGFFTDSELIKLDALWAGQSISLGSTTC